MARLSDIKVRTKLLVLCSIFVLGFVVIGAYSYNTLALVKVNGPYYQAISNGKDLIADILPPPEYIIEANLVDYQMQNEANPAKLDQLVRKSRSLKADYEARHVFWLKTLPEGSLKETMCVQSYQPAMAFFAIRDNQYIPALLHHDRARAASVLQGPLQQKYEEHRHAIDSVVTQATSYDNEQENQTALVIHGRTVALVGLAVGIMVAT